ncbi:MAG: type VI secretion system-associated protein TagO [Pseudomonadota bacterium]|jgi:hypothetical protein|nr:type VI secretion system-associated protein TagO [Pseudomonadota bacterium]MED5422509.1 type VI secretion system-associated protein TagO [Pseudomonadota bacterium]
MTGIKIIGGTYPKQRANYLANKLILKNNHNRTEIYIARAVIDEIEKVSEGIKTITYKVTLKSGKNFIGVSKRNIYDQLIAEQTTGPQDGDTTESLKQYKEKKVKAITANTPFQQLKARIYIASLYFFSICILCIAIGMGLGGLIFTPLAFAAWGLILIPLISNRLPEMTDKQRTLAFFAMFALACTGDIYLGGREDNTQANITIAAKTAAHTPADNLFKAQQSDNGLNLDIRKAKQTSLSKSVSPAFKMYSPISVREYDGHIFVQLPRPEITDTIYRNVIQAGFCLGVSFNKGADWSAAKSVTVVTKTKSQGWTFNGGENECEIINNVKMGETSPLIKEKTSAFKGQNTDSASQYKGQWRVGIEPSKIDDSTNVFLELSANQPFTNDLGQIVIPTLFIRCTENKTNIGVNWDTFLNLETISVLHRMDSEKAKTSNWTISSNNLAAFAPSPISFIRELIKHNKLLIQTTPHGANKITTEFYIYGLKNAIEPLQDACGWK